MLGTTANAMANMEAMVQRFGPAPRRLPVVPMVGAFFIDFANAILITLFLNIYRVHRHERHDAGHLARAGPGPC
jgi:ESS family glutamate:Na+ symporter